jgi:hypothetical protein
MRAIGPLKEHRLDRSEAVRKQIKSSLAELEAQGLAAPQPKVLVEGDDGAGRKTPVVMVSGSVEQLKASREGRAIVYTAKVEYVLHTMPDQSIAAKVSGSASAQASEQEANDQIKSAQLRKDVLEAAIASALRRAPPALVAAARL